jgi:hypothetical protein
LYENLKVAAGLIVRRHGTRYFAAWQAPEKIRFERFVSGHDFYRSLKKSVWKALCQGTTWVVPISCLFFHPEPASAGGTALFAFFAACTTYPQLRSGPLQQRSLAAVIT